MLQRALRHARWAALLRHSHVGRLHTACAAAAALAGEQKPSRGARKREAQRTVELAQQLCACTGKQLATLAGDDFLGEELVDAVALAQGIPRTNQARRRQVNLIAKLIRVMEVEDQQRVEDIASRLQTKGDVNADQAAFDQAENWLAGLVAGDPATAERINAIPPHWHDLQATRQLARRCQQAAAAAQEEAAEGADALQRAPGLVRAEKQLRKDLRLLAARCLREQAAEGAGS